MTLKAVILPITSVALLAACGTSGQQSTSKNPAVSTPATSTARVENTASANPTPEQTTVYTSKDPFIEPTLSEACGWEKPTMYFATDSDRLGLISDVKIDVLATCLKADPLEDRSVVLMGYADERGEDDYNLELGLERANTVKEELVAHGVAASRIETYSRGEYLVDGDDQLADDRRVVVKLDK